MRILTAALVTLLALPGLFGAPCPVIPATSDSPSLAKGDGKDGGDDGDDDGDDDNDDEDFRVVG
jgi:hypothetical protein